MKESYKERKNGRKNVTKQERTQGKNVTTNERMGEWKNRERENKIINRERKEKKKGGRKEYDRKKHVYFGIRRNMCSVMEWGSHTHGSLILSGFPKLES